jgi:flagellar basal-body rod protein FlgG
MSIGSFYHALSGMQAQQLRLDTIANNLSNLNTTGFKRKDIGFQDMLVRQLEQMEKLQLDGRKTPLGFPAGSGVKADLTLMDQAQGQPIETGQTWDVMIEGNGYFEVRRAGDEPELRRFTRDGHFMLSPLNADTGQLVTAQGDSVLDAQGLPIEVPLNREIRIDEMGNIYSTNPGFPEDGETLVARLSLVDVLYPQTLEWAGDNQYVLRAAPQEQEQMISYLTDQASPPSRIKQRFLEGSNVDVTQAMTRMIESQRAYQLNARALISSDEMLGLVNNMRR